MFSQKGVHLLGAPECGPGGCDNTPVGIVRPWGVHFEARASLFCLFEGQDVSAHWGGQGDGGTRCLAAGAFIELSRA